MTRQAFINAVERVLEPGRRRASDFGHRRGWEWLEYDPVTMLHFHRVAARDAVHIVDALERCFPEVQSLIDVGAGTGAMAAEWRRRERRVLACERNRFGRFVARLQGVPARRFSLTDRPPAEVTQRYDLALCLDVAEHIAESLAERLIRFLAEVAPIVVFSAAAVGQGGHFHVNEQGPAYWDSLFAKYAMREDRTQSKLFRRALAECGVDSPWRIVNTHVFIEC